MLAELDDVLRRDKFAQRLLLTSLTASELLLGYAALAKVVKPTMLVSVIVDDPDDNAVLECAIAAQAEAIVSGDNHLLKLKNFGAIPILTANELLMQLSK